MNENFDLNSFKIILFALSNAKLPEKYRCMYKNLFSISPQKKKTIDYLKVFFDK
jgi:hypothetical protein